MNKSHQPDYSLIIIIFILLVVGLITLASASSVLGFQNFKDPYYYLKHQIFLGLLPGLFLFLFFSLVNYKFWQKISLPLFIISLVLLIAVFIPGLGMKYRATRWLDLKFFSFQPVEFLKLSFIIFLANFFVQKEKKDNKFSSVFLPLLFILGVISFLIIRQPNISALLIVFLIFLTIYFVSGVKLSYLLIILMLAVILFFSLINLFPYLKDRLLAFILPDLEPQGVSYQRQQSLIAIGSGGLLGRGLGRSGQKFFYLPEAFGDSIFAIMAEELGFIITALIIFLFFLLIWRGFKVAKNSPDLFSQLVSVGITFWFAFQIIIHLGGMLGIFPLTGIPLPLVSYGGSAMSMNLAGLGLLVNISKYTTKVD